MFDRQSIHIALLLWGCIFCLIAAVCVGMSKNFDKQKRKWLILMQLSCAILLCSDACAWGFRGGAGAGAYVMVRISNFCVFSFSNIVLFFFHGYVLCCLALADSQVLIRQKAVYGIALAGVLLVVISQFTGLYYSFDANNFYHRNAGHIVSLLLPMSGMLLDLSLVIQYRRKISRQIYISMISYIVLPVVAAVILIFYYGISLINIAISISMILIFVVFMMEQNQLLARKEKEAADLRISIMISQITPHFIYNTLTSIQQMCGTDPEMAEETVSEFAEYLRGNLSSLDQKEPIPFEQELRHVQCYLAIEKKRFGDMVQVEMDIQEKEFQLPALTLQPIVENAIKHGIRKKKNGERSR